MSNQQKDGTMTTTMKDPYWVHMTPDEASAILDKSNTLNARQASPSHVRRLIAALKAGEWERTPDGIAFDKDGHLVNGQHRLMAIALSGISADLLFVPGVSVEAGVTAVDQGQKRSPKDVLRRAGIEHPSEIATIARGVMAFHHQFAPGLERGRGVIRPQEVLAFVRKVDPADWAHPRSIADASHRNVGVRRSVVGPLVFLTDRAAPDESEQFWHEVTAADAQPIDMTATLRIRLSRDNAGFHPGKGLTPGRAATRHLILLGWANWNLGINSQLRLLGAQPEVWPEYPVIPELNGWVPDTGPSITLRRHIRDYVPK